MVCTFEENDRFCIFNIDDWFWRQTKVKRIRQCFRHVINNKNLIQYEVQLHFDNPKCKSFRTYFGPSQKPLKQWKLEIEIYQNGINYMATFFYNVLQHLPIDCWHHQGLHCVHGFPWHGLKSEIIFWSNLFNFWLKYPIYTHCSRRFEIQIFNLIKDT